MRVVAFDRRPGSGRVRCQLHYRVVDETGTVFTRGDTAVTLARSADAVVLRPAHMDLFIGSYSIEVGTGRGQVPLADDAFLRSGGERTAARPRVRQMLDALAIATSEEVDAIRNLAPA